MRIRSQWNQLIGSRTDGSGVARSLARSLERALLLVALVSFAYIAYGAIDRVAFGMIEGRRFDEALSTAQARIELPGEEADTAPVLRVRASATRDGLLGRLEIPRTQLATLVLEGEDHLTLQRAVGHIPNTAFPGESGNVALAGHRDTFFRGLDRLRRDDRIFFTTPDGTYEYAVETTSVVSPNQVDILDPLAYPTLTLVTCYPFDFIGPAPLRYIVQARSVGRRDLPPVTRGPVTRDGSHSPAR